MGNHRVNQTQVTCSREGVAGMLPQLRQQGQVLQPASCKSLAQQLQQAGKGHHASQQQQAEKALQQEHKQLRKLLLG
jgi:hypothetical protein